MYLNPIIRLLKKTLFKINNSSLTYILMLPVTYKIRKIILLLNQGFLCVKIKKYLVKELKL